MNLPPNYNHGLLGNETRKAHSQSPVEDEMDALTHALNESLSADFPNARLRFTGNRTPPLGHAGSLLKQAEAVLAAAKQLSVALTGSIPHEPGHTPTARTHGLLSQLAQLDAEISRNLAAIHANIEHIRGQL